MVSASPSNIRPQPRENRVSPVNTIFSSQM